MKKFNIPCDFNGQRAPFAIYVGDPKPDHHPIFFQADWLSKERSGTVPQEVMDSLAKLKDLAEKNNVSFEDLCVYALGAAQEEAEGSGGAPEAGTESSGSEPSEAPAPAEEALAEASSPAVSAEEATIPEADVKAEPAEAGTEQPPEAIEEATTEQPATVESVPETEVKVAEPAAEETTNEEAVPTEGGEAKADDKEEPPKKAG